MVTFKRAIFLIFFILFYFNPDKSFALQTHPHPEGLYIHQLGHILFAVSMLFLFIYLNKRPVGNEKGWRYFKVSLILFLIWNINAFFGHLVEIYVPEDQIIKDGPFYKHYIDKPHDLLVYLYYIFKLDHIYCVPAMFFLVLSLKSFCKEISKKIN